MTDKEKLEQIKNIIDECVHDICTTPISKPSDFSQVNIKNVANASFAILDWHKEEVAKERARIISEIVKTEDKYLYDKQSQEDTNA